MKTALSQEEFNKTVANNLVAYRKFNNLTQLALAEKLNYSDKAVSKWEHGESIPDAYVLKCIADLYGVTVNDLISPNKKPKSSPKKARMIFVPLLSLCIVWIVATLVFFTLHSIFPSENFQWLSFIVAIPVTCIVALVFACIYKNLIMQCVTISGIIWSTALTLHLLLRKILESIYFLYIVGIPLQVLAILWYIYKGYIKKKNKQTKNHD